MGETITKLQVLYQATSKVSTPANIGFRVVKNARPPFLLPPTLHARLASKTLLAGAFEIFRLTQNWNPLSNHYKPELYAGPRLLWFIMALSWLCVGSLVPSWRQATSNVWWVESTNAFVGRLATSR